MLISKYFMKYTKDQASCIKYYLGYSMNDVNLFLHLGTSFLVLRGKRQILHKYDPMNHIYYQDIHFQYLLVRYSIFGSSYYNILLCHEHILLSPLLLPLLNWNISSTSFIIIFTHLPLITYFKHVVLLYLYYSNSLIT